MRNPQYKALAELIQGFLEQMEILAPQELPKEAELVRRLRQEKFLLNRAILSSQFCDELDLEDAAFLLYDEDKTAEEMAEQVTSLLDAIPNCGRLHIVVFVETIEQRMNMETAKKVFVAPAKKKIGGSAVSVDFYVQIIPPQGEVNEKIRIQSRIQSPQYPTDKEGGCSEDHSCPQSDVEAVIYIANL